MESNTYEVLLTKITIAEKRFKDYLSDTPTNVVQGNRGALKDAMNDLGHAFDTVPVPDGVAYGEVVKDALESLLPSAKPDLVKGDDAITSGVQTKNQDGSPVDGDDEVPTAKVDDDFEVNDNGALEDAIRDAKSSVDVDEINTTKDVSDDGHSEEEKENIPDDTEMFLTYPMAQVIAIAHVCHDTNRDYCISIGDDSQVPFAEAPENIQQSIISGVKLVLQNPEITAEQSHQKWVDYKNSEGWKSGAVKDYEAKTHPNLVPFDELPEAEQHKDELFIKTVMESMTE